MTLILAVALPIVANFAGPWQGWLDRARIALAQPTTHEPAAPAAPPPRPIEPAPSTIPMVPEPPPAASATPTAAVEPKSRLETRYEELLAKHLQQFPPPVVGKTYKVHLQDGSVDAGELVEATDGKVVIKMKYGKITYPIQVVGKRSFPALFPKQAAKIMALKELQTTLPAESAAATAAAPITTTKPAAAPAEAMVERTATTLTYDPTPGTSPEQFREVMEEYRLWLLLQQRRMGGQVAEKMQVKRHGQNVVLYLQVSKLFGRQPYDFRYGVTEALWNIWAFKCYDRSLTASLNRTHLVLVDAGTIVGGSSVEDGAAIWVKK